MAKSSVLCLILVALVTLGGAEDLCTLHNPHPDEALFARGAAKLQSAACLKIADEMTQAGSSSEWEQISQGSEHSLVWTKTMPQSNIKTVRICQEFIGIPPEDVYELEVNLSLRTEYDGIFETEVDCVISDSVDILYSMIPLPNLETRELYQYRKRIVGSNGFSIIYQDISDIPISGTRGKVRARVPFSGTLISAHPDCQKSDSTMMTDVYQIETDMATKNVDFMIDMKVEQYRIGLQDYYRDVYKPNKKN